MYDYRDSEKERIRDQNMESQNMESGLTCLYSLEFNILPTTSK
jgi:hypothetical protein